MADVGSLVGTAVGVATAFSSALRKRDIPEIITKSQGQATIKNEPNDWRVKIHLPPVLNDMNSKLFAPLKDSDNAMVFPLTPSIIIQHSANYNALQPTHTNYAYQVYQNSSIETITVTGEFIVETKADAAYWLATTHFLRSATKMFFGEGENAGNPPVICKLSGYGDYVFNKMPCVIQNFTIDLPQDVDYISSDVGVNVAEAPSKQPQSYAPASSQITVSLVPVYSRETIEKFTLKDFVTGGYLGNADTKGFI